MRKRIRNSEGRSDHSKAERVYRDLRRGIRDLALTPGSRLDKNELSKKYGVSRAPLSEAIARLASEGLVDVFPQSGSFVAAIRPQDIRDSMLIRTGLEVEAARRASQHATIALLAKLDANIEQQSAAIRAKDWATLDDLDESFHLQIMQAVDSPRALQLLDSTRAVLDRPRYHALPLYGRPKDSVAEHHRILDAIKTGDAELAGAAMRVHLTMVARAIECEIAKLETDAGTGGKK
jgi:DNA-binding GntR family transcriptional regulator